VSAFEPLISRIKALLDEQGCVLVAIDGGAASGKSTLAEALSVRLGAAVIHMDDFFLPPELRTAERLSQPGGNVHRERFLEEVLRPLAAGEGARFRPFDCGVMDFADSVTVPPRAVTLIEGAYSHHPDLRDFYDLRVFLEVPPALQRTRIEARNGEMAAQFFEEWIPLEQRYFEHFGIREKADVVVDAGDS
jgi:Uridine kinase